MFKVTPIDDGKEMNIEVNGTLEEILSGFLKVAIGTIELISEQTDLSKEQLASWFSSEVANFYSEDIQENKTTDTKEGEE